MSLGPGSPCLLLMSVLGLLTQSDLLFVLQSHPQEVFLDILRMGKSASVNVNFITLTESESLVN